jgi:hypothetical protein
MNSCMKRITLTNFRRKSKAYAPELSSQFGAGCSLQKADLMQQTEKAETLLQMCKPLSRSGKVSPDVDDAIHKILVGFSANRNRRGYYGYHRHAALVKLRNHSIEGCGETTFVHGVSVSVSKSNKFIFAKPEVLVRPDTESNARQSRMNSFFGLRK